MSTYKRNTPRGPFNLCRALEAMASARGVNYNDMPIAIAEASSLRGAQRGLDAHSLAIPYGELTRDLLTSTTSAGGALLGSTRDLHTGSLRGYSVAADAGVIVMTEPFGSNTPSIPVISGAPVAGFVASEGAAVPESDAVFGLRTATTKTAGVRCNVSRKLLIQGGEAADALVRRELMQAVGRAVDRAVLQGNGTTEPTGLLSVAGVTDQAGASLAWAGVVAMQRAVSSASVRDETMRYIGTPIVRELLQKREKATGSGLIWNEGRIDGVPGSVSVECPAGALFLGDWSTVVVMLHGGITLTVDPRYSMYGSIRLVAMVDVAVEVLHPGAFARATSIT